jgi:type II secretion system protein G
MKLFITVFSAIIAAAIVIGSALWAVDRVKHSERAKQDRKDRDHIKQEFDKDARRRVEEDLQVISTQLNLYESLTGTYPTTEQGIRALVEQPTTDPRPTRWYQLFRDVPKDPCGHDYVYRSPDGTSYTVFSAGADGVPDTADDIRKP